MMDAVGHWLWSLGATRQALLIAAVGFFIIGVGAFLLWLASVGDEYKGVRKRKRNPDPWDIDPHTGENIIVPAPKPTNDFPRHIPAEVIDTGTRLVSHHSAERMGEGTTLIEPAKVAAARAMVVDRDKMRRALSVDWRDAWIVTGAHPSVYDTGRIPVPCERPAEDRTRAWRAGSARFLEEEELYDDGDYPR